ncbi:MAG: cyanophycinase [Acidobacteria bacterium]|nr:cyanophycinase [Acidobacteriota bacterium]MBS1867773.1 cyanophycinase [Acidobacteriota bacterium]
MHAVCRVGFIRFVFPISFFVLITFQPPASAKYKYFRSGNAADIETKPRAGFALMGGGAHQEQAWKFLCERANGGDFLILRANTEDDYAKQINEETLKICPLNSAATIVFDDRDGSDDPKIAEIIAHAESIFFAGGDQSNYIRFWQDTPIQDALNKHIAAGKTIGGSSAGLAILGEFSFSSMIDTIHSPDALADPYGNKITLSREFLKIPLLAGTITDTHFVKRDRLGRTLVFMARILNDGWAKKVRAIAVEENAAVLLDANGTASIVGGPAYFYESSENPEVCKHKVPLTFKNVFVHLAPAGTSFDLKKWTAEKGENYALNVENGKISAGSSRKGVY